MYCSDDQVESDDGDELNIGSKKKRKKAGRKTKWAQEMLNDFIDIIVISEYNKKKLIFMNTNTQRNGGIYENILKELNKRCAKRGEKVHFTVQQLRSKFKKCVGTCKQAVASLPVVSNGFRKTKDLDSGSIACIVL